MATATIEIKEGKYFTVTAVIDGEMVPYDKERLFSEVDNKATYKMDQQGHSKVDNATWNAAFKALAELRGVTDDTAYHWIHEIAAEMVDHYKELPSLADLYECEGPVVLMEPMDRMQALLGLIFEEYRK